MSEPQLSILLVEDNPVNQLYLKTLLARKGHEVSIATDGAEAVQVFQEEKFDLIFMDLQMPGTDGFEAAERIRDIEQKAAPHSKRTPISALSAYPLREETHRKEIEHFDHYLTKPVTKQMIEEAIAKLTSRPPDESRPPNKTGSSDRPDAAAEKSPESAPEVHQVDSYVDFLLKQFRDSEEDLKAMLQMALSDLPQKLTQLDYCFKTHDIQSGCENAHSIAKIVGALYASTEREYALKLETLIKTQNWNRARSDYFKLQERVQSLVQTYRLVLNRELG